MLPRLSVAASLFFFQLPLSWWNTFCLLYCYGSYLQLFAIQMPFFRNWINYLDFIEKIRMLKSQSHYSLAGDITMCYSIVTKRLHSLLVFVKKSILLEFYDVRLCMPRRCRYIFVTFFCLPEPRPAVREKNGRMIP